MSARLLTHSPLTIPVVCVFAIGAVLASRSLGAGPRTFASPEDAARALIEVAKAGTLGDLMMLLGPEAQPLVDASDPKTARQHRDVFVVAAAEGWHLTEDGPDARVLVVGHESWPFPVPIVKDANEWRFDAAAGVEEVLARRVGRNSSPPFAPAARTLSRKGYTQVEDTTGSPRASRTRRRSGAIPAGTTVCIGPWLAARSGVRLAI